MGIPAADPSEEPPVCGAEDMCVKSGSWVECRWEIEIVDGMGRCERWVVEKLLAWFGLCLCWGGFGYSSAGLTVCEKTCT